MRARLLNTPPRVVVAPGVPTGRRLGRSAPDRSSPGRCSLRRALALLAAGACCIGIAACGSGDPQSAQTLLNATFKSHQPIESGRISLSLTLAPVGTGVSSKGKGPLSARLQGPFQSAGAGRLPHFALQAELGSGGLLSGGGQTLHVGAISTGGQLYIVLGGTPFLAPASTVQALQQGYTQASRTAASSGGTSTFATLGVDPGEWLTQPSLAGNTQIAGSATVHIVAHLNAAHFFADASKLSGAGGALAQGASGGAAGLFAPSQLAALRSSLRSARVDVYTGAQDHLLRRLTVRVTLAAPPGDASALGGLSAATLTLDLQLAQLNQPQTITAPANPQPISQLVPVLERLGLIKGPLPVG